MTATIWPEEMVKAFSPDYVAPIVGYLASDVNEHTKGIFEASGGWLARTRWQRTFGHAFPSGKATTPEKVKAKWDAITKFDDEATYPTTPMEANESIMGNIGNGTNIKVGEATFVDQRNFPGGPNAYFATGGGPIGLTCNVVYIINSWFQDGLLVRKFLPLRFSLIILTQTLRPALPFLDVLLPSWPISGHLTQSHVSHLIW